MPWKKMDSGSKDWINELPDQLLCHILSFLPTKEAASTSVISKRWRHLLAFVPNLEFDDSVYLHPEIEYKRKKRSTVFVDFMDRILDLQHKFRVHKFSLKIVNDHDPVDPDCVIPWIHNALVRDVSDLHLVMNLNLRSPLPSRIFLSETMVRLRIDIRDGPMIDTENVHLPKLKTLHLESISFKERNIGFNKLLSDCPVLEELVLHRKLLYLWSSYSVSVTTLKRLRFCESVNPNPDAY